MCKSGTEYSFIVPAKEDTGDQSSVMILLSKAANAEDGASATSVMQTNTKFHHFASFRDKRFTA